MYAFHRVFYKILWVLVSAWYKLTGRYRWTPYRQKSESALILTNHTTNWDFLLVGVALFKHMYFVASEHIFRRGFVSRLLVFFVDPIPRKKGAPGSETAKAISKRLKRRCNVCMMAEGNRSFTGETGFISPATAAVVRGCGSGLITFRIHGGYLVNPRWSRVKRKGPMWGEAVREYSAEELAAMSDDEIMAHIREDLYVNAFEDQKGRDYSYSTEAPAEDLQTALFCCPDCGTFSRMTSKGDRFICEACGSVHVFNERGFFERPDGGEPAFATVLDWSRWQQEKLKEHIAGFAGDTATPIFTSPLKSLSLVHPLEGTDVLSTGPLRLYTDRLEAGEGEDAVVLPLDKISKLAITLVNTMLLTCGGDYYEIKLADGNSALQFLISYYILTGREYK